MADGPVRLLHLTPPSSHPPPLSLSESVRVTGRPLPITQAIRRGAGLGQPGAARAPCVGPLAGLPRPTSTGPGSGPPAWAPSGPGSGSARAPPSSHPGPPHAIDSDTPVAAAGPDRARRDAAGRRRRRGRRRPKRRGAAAAGMGTCPRRGGRRAKRSRRPRRPGRGWRSRGTFSARPVRDSDACATRIVRDSDGVVTRMGGPGVAMV